MVHTHSAAAMTIAATMAQTPGLDEAALAANDTAMIGNISNNYNFHMSASFIAGAIGQMAGKAVGVKLFTKLVSWMPGPGNAVNAGVAGSVTEALGHSYIEFCEYCKRKGISPTTEALRNFRR